MKFRVEFFNLLNRMQFSAANGGIRGSNYVPNLDGSVTTTPYALKGNKGKSSVR